MVPRVRWLIIHLSAPLDSASLFVPQGLQTRADVSFLQPLLGCGRIEKSMRVYNLSAGFGGCLYYMAHTK
jgi:hypothetical protein